MAITNIYINFKGDCEKAFNFYKSVFGGEFSYISRFGDIPQGEIQAHKVNDAIRNKIMHVSLPIGSSVLMGSDINDEYASSFIQGNNFSVSVTANTKDEADRIYNSLATGGQISMPMGQTFWGEYFGMCIDQFGINWMVSFRMA